MFDLGSTHSLCSLQFSKRITQLVEPFDFDRLVTTPLGNVVFANREAKECLIDIDGRGFVIDLILQNMNEFEIIVGMD